MWCTCDAYLPQLIAHSEQRSKTIDRFLTTAFSCSGSAGLVASLAWLEVTNSHMPPPKKTSPRIYTFLTGAFSDYKMPENPLFILYFLCTCLKFLIFHGGNYPLLPPLRTPMVTNRYFARGLRGGRVTRHPARTPVPGHTQGVVYPSPDDYVGKISYSPILGRLAHTDRRTTRSTM